MIESFMVSKVICVFLLQAIIKRQHAQSCEGCGSTISLRMLRKMNDTASNNRLLCNSCARVSVTCLVFIALTCLTLVIYMVMMICLCIAVDKIKTCLWYMQKNMESC